MRKLLVTLASTGLALLGPAAGAEAPTVDLSPASLPRGADVAVPHVEGRTIVDGEHRIAVDAPRVTLLGTAGPAGRTYVVAATDRDGFSHGRVLRIQRDGDRRVVLRGTGVLELTLSRDGERLIRATTTRDHTVLRVLSARNGELVRKRTFPGTVSVLDAAEGRAILGSWSPNRTFWWSFRTDRTQRISKRIGYAADIGAGRVASFTRDPYQGGCSIVTALGRPATVLWRSCQERAEEFSPDGRRVAAVHILSDGIGPRVVTVRRIGRGGAVASYRARWFGELRWETDTALLLDANGKHRSATVRCVAADCERASDLRSVPRV